METSCDYCGNPSAWRVGERKLCQDCLALHLHEKAWRSVRWLQAAGLATVVLVALFVWWLVGRVEQATDATVAGERSGRWPAVRRAYLETHPVCEACGTSADLEVHHVLPFHERPDLELEEHNLITLCRRHHWEIGHDPDGPWEPARPSWTASNAGVWQDASRFRNAGVVDAK